MLQQVLATTEEVFVSLRVSALQLFKVCHVKAHLLTYLLTLKKRKFLHTAAVTVDKMCSRDGQHGNGIFIMFYWLNAYIFKTVEIS